MAMFMYEYHIKRLSNLIFGIKTAKTKETLFVYSYVKYMYSMYTPNIELQLSETKTFKMCLLNCLFF